MSTSLLLPAVIAIVSVIGIAVGSVASSLQATTFTQSSTQTTKCTSSSSCTSTVCVNGDCQTKTGTTGTVHTVCINGKCTITFG